jgi:hypothetical protein
VVRRVERLSWLKVVLGLALVANLVGVTVAVLALLVR